MKPLCLFIIFLVQMNCLPAQQRGMKPVRATIEGKQTILYNQSHALLFGISNYTNGWANLPGVVNDIPRIRQTLENYGFEVEVVMDPTKVKLEQTLSGFINTYGDQPDNRLIIYYAGHGYSVKRSDGSETGYLMPADAPSPDNSALFRTKAFEMGLIGYYAKTIISKHVLFLFDACFAGSIFSQTRSATPAYISYATLKPVRQFISSGSAFETVLDRGCFTDKLIAGMKGAADMDKDGYITGSELGIFLQKEVMKESQNTQHPQFGKIIDANYNEGDFVFVVSDYKGSLNDPGKPDRNNNNAAWNPGSGQGNHKGDMASDNQNISQRIKDLEIRVVSFRKSSRSITAVLKFSAIGDKYGTGYALKADGSDGIADYWKFSPSARGRLTDDMGNEYYIGSILGMGYAREQSDWTVLRKGEEATANIEFMIGDPNVKTGTRFDLSLELWVFYPDAQLKSQHGSFMLNLTGIGL